MPVTPTYPGIYIEEVPSSARTITPAPTSIAVFVGYAHPFQGECARTNRWADPLEVFSFTDYERKFGGVFGSDRIDNKLGHAVNNFFRNGGSHAFVVGLKPQYYDQGNLNAAEAITGASDTLENIVFTSKQLTSDEDPMKVTLWNIRTVDSVQVADIMITHGRKVETYRAVQKKDPTAGNYIEKLFERSNLVAVGPDGAYGDTYGAEGSRDLGDMPLPSFPMYTTYRPSDYISVFEDHTPLDKLPIFNLLATPGVFDAGVTSAAIGFCDKKRALFLMDPPPTYSADGTGGPAIEQYMAAPPFPKHPNAALYFPYLKSLDPITGRAIEVPPSGYLAGIYARTDRTRGVWKAPAGLQAGLRNTTGVVDTGKMTDMKQGTLNPKGVNVVRAFPGLEPVVWGARTLASENPAREEWRYVPVRRMALFLEQTLIRSLGWAVFEPNDEPLWGAMRLSVENFMMSLFRQGAFQGRTPSEAFSVRCDDTTTTSEDVALGVVNLEVGFAPLKPAEFVIVKIAQLAGQATT